MLNADNARIYGSDLDSIFLAPIGTPLPTTIDEPLHSAFEDIGWLHEDGIVEGATGSKELVRGHQGGGVVRTRISESGTTIGFTALESKAQTKALRYDEKSVTVSNGVRKVKRGAGQKVKRRAAVIDMYDTDNTTVKDRLIIPVLEILPDGDRSFVNSDISGFAFTSEIIGDYESLETIPEGTALVWNLTIGGTPTGGTFSLAIDGASTAPIAYNASASNIAAAINALSGVTGITGVTAAGTAPTVLTFPQPVTLAADGSALTGGTDPDATVAAA